jgi:hypothetical protein
MCYIFSLPNLAYRSYQKLVVNNVRKVKLLKYCTGRNLTLSARSVIQQYCQLLKDLS